MIRKITARGTVWILMQNQLRLQNEWKLDTKILHGVDKSCALHKSHWKHNTMPILKPELSPFSFLFPH